MKVKLIKDLHIGKKGEIKTLPDPMANYLILMKAVEPELKEKRTYKKKL